MGFIAALFSNKKESDEKSAATSSSHSSRDKNRSRKSGKDKRSSKPKKQLSLDNPATAVEDQLTPNEKVITEYVSMLNSHAPVEDLLKCFASPDVKVVPEDGPTVSALEFNSALRACYLSFEDISFDGHSIKETKPGVVLVEDNIVSGTHTGAPFQPVPNVEPVPANGKYVLLDPELVYFHLKEGKIVKVEVIALGSSTGVIGLYTLVGGKL